MNKSTVREVCKFAAGLVCADFIFSLWLYFGNVLPMNFLGIQFNAQGVVVCLIFDALLFACLFHYGWRLPERPRTGGERQFHIVAGIVFTLIALLHLSRIVFGWNFMFGSWNAPYWINGLGTVITAFLAYVSFHLAGNRD